MSRSHQWDEDERPTSRNNRSPTDMDHTVGQLMAESLNHRRRIEVLEKRLQVMETSPTFSVPPEGGSTPPSGRSRLFALIRKTVVTTAVIIAAIISALKELGFLVR